MNYIDGNLIDLSKKGMFNVISHGCNCFCKQKSGIAKQMVENFKTDEFEKEKLKYKGDVNKLGTIDYGTYLKDLGKCIQFDKDVTLNRVKENQLIVVNSYTQFRYGRNHPDGQHAPVDYDAIRLCMRKINKIFKGLHIGLPKIGSGLAGGNWYVISEIIKEELSDMKVTIVNYKK